MNKIIELPVKELKYRYILPKGKYWFGDLKFALNEDDWFTLQEFVFDVCKKTEGIFELPDGRQFGFWPTRHGSGEYWDNNGENWRIDSEWYGITLEENITTLDTDGLIFKDGLFQGRIFEIDTLTEISIWFWRFTLGDFEIDFDENFLESC